MSSSRGQFVLTDKGERRLDTLGNKLHGSTISDSEIEDYLVLNGIHVGATPVSGPRSEFAPVLRRLFEAGYIDYA